MKTINQDNVWKISKYLENKYYNFSRDEILEILSKNFIDEAYSKISKWLSYEATPLISLNKLSKELNLNNVFYKDESKRFGLKSFKALGGAYAVEKVSNGEKNITISTAYAPPKALKDFKLNLFDSSL